MVSVNHGNYRGPKSFYKNEAYLAFQVILDETGTPLHWNCVYAELLIIGIAWWQSCQFHFILKKNIINGKRICYIARPERYNALQQATVVHYTTKNTLLNESHRHFTQDEWSR